MNNFLKLTNDEEEKLKKYLLNFIQRVSSEKAEYHEIQMFYDIVRLLVKLNLHHNVENPVALEQ